MDRRRFLALCSAAGFGGGAALWAAGAAEGPVTPEMLAAAERLSGLEFTPEERELALQGIQEQLESYRALRQVPIPNSLEPAIAFQPLLPGRQMPTPVGARTTRPDSVPPRPADPEAVAFQTVASSSEQIRRGEITSVELTETYLERLRRLGPKLECVISLTEERALEAAAEADAEIAAGRWRGPLHGIPWGAKDLLAVAGYPTTWGAEPFREQRFDESATAVRRLDEAGAVLVAKLTLGALAWGDVWFGGKTRNPWNLEQGSSGSSAGSASASAAGLVGFAIGSETWGSIVSPSTRCGTSGIRPTFGRVSRHGAMALSWSMDKLGPIGRSIEDCALVLEAIVGPDGRDGSVVDHPFAARPDLDPREVRLGYVPALFDEPLPDDADEGDREWRRNDETTLEDLARLGFDLVPVELPDLPVEALSFILSAEAAAAFDDLTRSGEDDRLTRQVEQAWPNVFRQARTIPAVEYLQANRVRRLVMERMAEVFEAVDVYVSPSFGGDNLLLTNLTGHPMTVVPNGFRSDGTPTSITFTGDLFREEALVEVSRLYQEKTAHHLVHPDLG